MSKRPGDCIDPHSLKPQGPQNGGPSASPDDELIGRTLQNFAVCRDYIGTEDFSAHLLLCFGQRRPELAEIDDLFQYAHAAITRLIREARVDELKLALEQVTAYVDPTVKLENLKQLWIDRIAKLKQETNNAE